MSNFNKRISSTNSNVSNPGVAAGFDLENYGTEFRTLIIVITIIMIIIVIVIIIIVIIIIIM